MALQLPSIGRGTITVKRLYGSDNKGDVKVSSSASFIAGMVATRTTDSNGNVVLAVCDASATPCGVFGVHKTTSFLNPVVDEAVSYAAGSTTGTLNHATVQNVVVKDATGGSATEYTLTSDYTVTAANGLVTRTSTGNIWNSGAAATVYVSYRYESTELAGIDETLGSNKATVWEGPGEFEILVYDTGNLVSLGDTLRCDANGLLSTASGLTGTAIGAVTRAPSASDATLRFKMYGNY